MGRLLDALRVENRGLANSAKTANKGSEDCKDSRIREIRKGTEPNQAADGSDQISVEHSLPEILAARAQLIAVAHTAGIPPALVHAVPESDLVAYASLPVHLVAGYLEALSDTVTRHAGHTPAGDTAPAFCLRCGPVWLHPGLAAALPVVGGWVRALGCPWCFVRKAGGHVPRPAVSCADCQHFLPHPRDPSVGMGACAGGYEARYPMEKHNCIAFAPGRRKADLAK